MKGVIAQIQAKLGHSHVTMKDLEARLHGIEGERNRIMGLYRRELIDEKDIERGLGDLNEQRYRVAAEIERIRAATGLTEVSDATLREVIGRLGEESRCADPKIKKRVVQTLFEEIRISPKEGHPWERTLEIRGVYLPLTGVFVASPRGFEPLLPT
jgi:hypothetical protein